MPDTNNKINIDTRLQRLQRRRARANSSNIIKAVDASKNNVSSQSTSAAAHQTFSKANVTPVKCLQIAPKQTAMSLSSSSGRNSTQLKASQQSLTTTNPAKQTYSEHSTTQCSVGPINLSIIHNDSEKDTHSTVNHNLQYQSASLPTNPMLHNVSPHAHGANSLSLKPPTPSKESWFQYTNGTNDPVLSPKSAKNEISNSISHSMKQTSNGNTSSFHSNKDSRNKEQSAVEGFLAAKVLFGHKPSSPQLGSLRKVSSLSSFSISSDHKEKDIVKQTSLSRIEPKEDISFEDRGRVSTSKIALKSLVPECDGFKKGHQQKNEINNSFTTVKETFELPKLRSRSQRREDSAFENINRLAATKNMPSKIQNQSYRIQKGHAQGEPTHNAFEQTVFSESSKLSSPKLLPSHSLVSVETQSSNNSNYSKYNESIDHRRSLKGKQFSFGNYNEMKNTNDASMKHEISPARMNKIEDFNVENTIDLHSQNEKNSNIFYSDKNRALRQVESGTPVWIHKSLLKDQGFTHMGWEWIRAYMLENCNTKSGNAKMNTNRTDVVLTVVEPTSESFGVSFSISNRCDALMLMGNSWWSTSNPGNPIPYLARSPTSTTQFESSTLLSNRSRPNMPPEDLVELTHLHEPAIVYALQARYERDLIYTNTGAILLALNPFKRLDYLYTRDVMELYWTDNRTVDADSESDGIRVTRPLGEEEYSNAIYEDKMKNPLPPHAYAVAERAFSSMIQSLEKREELTSRLGTKTVDDLPPCDQSILVSGESGAGKTVTTKIIMRYLAILSQRRMSRVDDCASDGQVIETNENSIWKNGWSVETQVLQSNPILESFGNARTVRNDNSSRFGKFIEMIFQVEKSAQSSAGSSHCKSRGALLGASIDFYLLEKVRLVSVNVGERNYHIFYEILSHGMDLKEKRSYMLTSNFGRGSTFCTANDFKMTSMSGTFDRRDGVQDIDTFRELRTAMDTVGFSVEEKQGIFCLVSALLHASNLRFVAERGQNNGNDCCIIYEKDGILLAISTLLGLSEEALKVALTANVIEARGELLRKKLSIEQAEKALEALTKATYGALFAYIIKRINKSIEVNENWSSGECGGTLRRNIATIGVLDIFGFESFEFNSFEQLCINYCNEALQQQFNRYVFKAEQSEYENEGIEWSSIEFPDNQETLDLIEDRRLGIFSVLDEQCRVPGCTDGTFARAVYDRCDSSNFLTSSQMQRSLGKFVIIHYAGEVEYDSSGFLVKNKDELPKSTGDLLSSSNVPLIAELSRIISESDSSTVNSSVEANRVPIRRSSSSISRSSVSSQFASQLRNLRSRISVTGPHYIRCLKPNDRLIADHFDETIIAHQLNCAGVLPAMKLARTGFAMRYSHAAFIQRYRLILSPSKTRAGSQSISCHHLVNNLSDRLERMMRKRFLTNLDGVQNVVSWALQIGKTKVFLRTDAFEALEELRNNSINEAATKLQAQARAYLCQSAFFLTLGSILALQCATRKLIATLYVRRLRYTAKAIVIQKSWKSYAAWSSFQNVLFLTTWCQRFWRGGKVREGYSVWKENRAASSIQTFWRTYVLELTHRRVSNATVLIQCFFRVRLSKKVFYQLRKEARDLHLVATERDELRMEMKRMQRELEDLKRNQTMSSSASTNDSKGSLVRPHLADLSTHCQSQQIKLLYQECVNKDRELHLLRQQVESLRGSGRSVSSTLPSTVTVDSVSRITHTPHHSSFMTTNKSPFTSINLSTTEPNKVQPSLFSLNLLDSELDDPLELDNSHVSFHENSNENSYELSFSMSPFDTFIKPGDFPIHNAILRNDSVAFVNEINKSADIDLEINSVDSKGRTALHVAVQCSNTDLILLILTHNVVVNSQDFAGNTPLHCAESAESAEILLSHGANPNIPNCDGLCALHFAVKKGDFSQVKSLLSHGADINYADNICWYTPLHLIAHAETSLETACHSARGPIAELLCQAKHPSSPDLNYQDRDGNTPLHHAASLGEKDAGILISLFIEHGSSPEIVNIRGQSPIHFFCHNHLARQYVFYHEVLQLMLARGANPNQQSLSGCTALHLALYHQDITAASILVRYGAELNAEWKKPMKWDTFWTDMGSDVVLPLDMLEDLKLMHLLIGEINTLQNSARHRSKCMHCKAKFGLFGRQHTCSNCGRSVCGRCLPGSLPASFLSYHKKNEDLESVKVSRTTQLKVCILCEALLLSRDACAVPTCIIQDENASELSIGTISM